MGRDTGGYGDQGTSGDMGTGGWGDGDGNGWGNAGGMPAGGWAPTAASSGLDSNISSSNADAKAAYDAASFNTKLGKKANPNAAKISKVGTVAAGALGGLPGALAAKGISSICFGFAGKRAEAVEGLVAQGYTEEAALDAMNGYMSSNVGINMADVDAVLSGDGEAAGVAMNKLYSSMPENYQASLDAGEYDLSKVSEDTAMSKIDKLMEYQPFQGQATDAGTQASGEAIAQNANDQRDREVKEGAEDTSGRRYTQPFDPNQPEKKGDIWTNEQPFDSLTGVPIGQDPSGIFATTQPDNVPTNMGDMSGLVSPTQPPGSVTQPGEIDYPTNPYVQQAQEALLNMTEELKEIGEIRELSDLSGEVTENEKRLLDEMEQNSINTLTEAVNDQTSDYLKTQISSLVNKGVLQGGVGEAAISKIGEEALKQVRQGTTNISNARMAQELEIIDQNKKNQMELWKWGDTVDLQKAELGIEAAGKVGQIGVGQESVETEWELGKEKIKTGWEQAKLDAQTRLYGIEKGAETTLAGQATQASIAQGQAEAAEDASWWNAVGNIGGSLINQDWDWGN